MGNPKSGYERSHYLTHQLNRSQVEALKNIETNLQQLEQSYQSTPTTEVLCKITEMKYECNSLYNNKCFEDFCSELYSSNNL